MRLNLGRRLRSVPELGPFEINVGALSDVHVGKLIALALKRNTLTGRLMHVPMQSMGDKRLLVVQLGDFSRALHASDVVMVVPDSHKATVVIEAVD